MMEKLKEIRSFEELKDFIVLNKDSIKKAALPLTVAVAILFFWLSGLGADTEIQESGITAQNDADGSQYEEGYDNDYSDDYDGNYDENSENSENSGDANYNASTAQSQIYVDIGGCIKKPGVYKVAQGTRLFQVIGLAGGLTEDADTYSINQAEEVYDGQKIIIYSINDDANNGTGTYSNSSSSSSQTSDLTGKININRADASELQEIPGVGPATAQKIIEYRESEGLFNSIEDIKNVSGIGDKTFESMKEYITV